MARANAPNNLLSERYASWPGSTANHLTSSPSTNSSNTSCIEKTLMDSHRTPCASAPTVSDSSSDTSWSATGRYSTSCRLNPHAAFQPSSVCRKCVAFSGRPHLGTITFPSPPSRAWDSGCTKDSFSTLPTSTANDSWSTCTEARVPRTAPSLSLRTPSRSYDTPGPRTDIPPGSFPPPGEINSRGLVPPDPCTEAASKGIGLKLSVDCCYNFNRFSLLSQTLVQDLRACPSFS